MSQCLVEMDTDGIGIAHGNLVEGNRVFAIGTLTRHIDHCLHTGLLIGRHAAL